MVSDLVEIIRISTPQINETKQWQEFFNHLELQ